MRTIIAWLFVSLGIVLGVYVGAYLLFFRGIVQALQNVNPIVPTEVAWGIVKTIFAYPIGFIIAVFGIAIGKAIIDD